LSVIKFKLSVILFHSSDFLRNFFRTSHTQLPVIGLNLSKII